MDSTLIHTLEAIQSTIDHLAARIIDQQNQLKTLRTLNSIHEESQKYTSEDDKLFSLPPPKKLNDKPEKLFSFFSSSRQRDNTHVRPKIDTKQNKRSHRFATRTQKPNFRTSHFPTQLCHSASARLPFTLPARQVFNTQSSPRHFTFQLPPRLVFNRNNPGSLARRNTSTHTQDGKRNSTSRKHHSRAHGHTVSPHTRNAPKATSFRPTKPPPPSPPLMLASPSVPQPVSDSLSLPLEERSENPPLSSPLLLTPPSNQPEKARRPKSLKHISLSPVSSFCLFSPVSPVTSLSKDVVDDCLPASKSSALRFSSSHSLISFSPSDPPLLLRSSLPSTLRPGFFKWGTSIRPPKVSSFLSFFDSLDYDPPFPYQDDAFLPQGPRKSRISPLFVPLKPIPKDALDFSYLSNSACKVSPDFGRGYQTLISYITELESFLSLFLSLPPQIRPGKRSKLSQRDLADLLNWQVLLPCPRSIQPPFFHFSFKVLKSDPSWSRYIIDCSVLNSYQKDPPSFSLPSPLRIIETILSCEFGFVTDFSAWFHQHWISPEISPFFAVRVNSSPFLCSRLAQGWKFSPCTAQGSSVVLVFDPDFPDSPSLSWIDDNFFGDSSESRLDIRRKNFLDRCAQAHAKIGAISDISDSVVYVGMEFQLKEKKWRIKPSWTEKLLAFFLSLSLSQEHFHAPAQVLWMLLGSFLWFLRCSCLPLALLDPLISQTIDISPRLIDGSLLWTDVISFWPSVVSCCLSLISLIEKNAWRFIPHPLPFNPTKNFLFSDASLSGGAVVFEGKVIWSTTWDFDTAHTDILYLETLAWAAGIRLIPSLSISSAVTVVDNEALYFSLLKTRSKNPKVNAVITDVCLWAESKHLLLYTGWISTILMPADGPSRGQPIQHDSPSHDNIRLSSHPFVFASDFML